LGYKEVLDCRNNKIIKDNFHRNGDHIRPHKS
jgi:hypothetical protein